jgi:hypothetical protein
MREKKQFLDQFLVSALSRSAVIPTYSFPVHSIRLEISETRTTADASRFTQDASLQLDRDAALAIGEYAPGAEVVAGGRIWTSRGIVRRSQEYMPLRYYRICKACGHPEIRDDREQFADICEQCSGDPQTRISRSIAPTAFLTSLDEKRGRDPGSSRLRARPVDEARLLTRAHFRDYADTDLSGVRTFFAPATPIGGEIGGRLFVVNRGPKGAGYLWCRRCEYAEPAPQSALFGQSVVNSVHKNPRTGERCPHEELNYPFDLGHIFETDIRAIGFSVPPPSFQHARSERERAEKLEGFSRTLAEALRIATAELLEADPRDIRSSKELREGRPLVVLSDAVAGGAGYVQRLFEDPAFSAKALIGAAIRVVDCSRPDCATSCSKCMNDYSNQAYWDVFDRLPVLDWLHALISEVVDRPPHAPENSIPVKSFNYSGLEEQLRSAEQMTICAASIQGARDTDRALTAVRVIRDYCEADQRRKVALVVSLGLPLSQSPLSTLDREVIDLVIRFEDLSQLEVFFAPRSVVEKAPRVAIRRGDKTFEYYGFNFDQPIFDDLLGAPIFLSTSRRDADWWERESSGIRKIEGAFGVTALNTKAFRHDAGRPRVFKAIFANIAGRTVDLQIEDPYLASGPRNRTALVGFLSKLKGLGVDIASLTLAWRPARSDSSSDFKEERPEEQQRALSSELEKIGFGSGVVHLKPRASRLAHFHDRVVTATPVGDGADGMAFRWDITSGIDNLMERDRQCSVFLTSSRDGLGNGGVAERARRFR